MPYILFPVLFVGGLSCSAQYTVTVFTELLLSILLQLQLMMLSQNRWTAAQVLPVKVSLKCLRHRPYLDLTQQTIHTQGKASAQILT